MEFTSDWFSHNIPNWQRHLVELAGRPLRILEIGSHEGRSAVWMLDRLMTNSHSELHCIDLWESPDVWKRFQSNIVETGRATRVRVYQGQSDRVLRSLTGPFDLIYIDGDHEARSVMIDTAICWGLLASGGILIFDDYRWTGEVEFPPQLAIDLFLQLWMTQIDVLHKGYQVIVRRR